MSYHSAIMVALIEGSIAPVVVFMVGTVLALAMNYPGAEAQHARIDAHARAACMIASIYSQLARSWA